MFYKGGTSELFVNKLLRGPLCIFFVFRSECCGHVGYKAQFVFSCQIELKTNFFLLPVDKSFCTFFSCFFQMSTCEYNLCLKQYVGIMLVKLYISLAVKNLKRPKPTMP